MSESSAVLTCSPSSEQSAPLKAIPDLRIDPAGVFKYILIKCATAILNDAFKMMLIHFVLYIHRVSVHSICRMHTYVFPKYCRGKKHCIPEMTLAIFSGPIYERLIFLYVQLMPYD